LSLLAPESLSERGFVVVVLLLFAMRRSRFFVFSFFSFDDDDVREQRKGSILFNRIPGKDEEEEI